MQFKQAGRLFYSVCDWEPHQIASLVIEHEQHDKQHALVFCGCRSVDQHRKSLVDRLKKFRRTFCQSHQSV
jgi:hypothetical protein